MILCDGNHALNRTIFMNLEQVKQSPEFTAHLIFQMFSSIATQFGASKENQMIIAKDNSSWRKAYYEENKTQFKDLERESYKGNRTKSSDIPWNKIFEVYEKCSDILNSSTDFKVISTKGAEADDVIAVLAKKFKAQETIWIVSSDKDFVQLQDTNVHMYDPIKRQFIPPTDVNHYKKIHILVAGDDNIKSVKSRLGPKTAEKMIKELDLILQTDPMFKARYEFNRNLIDFECIPEYISEAILNVYNNAEMNYNQINLIKAFKEFKLAQMMDNTAKFKLPATTPVTKLNSTFTQISNMQQKNNQMLSDFFGE